MIICLVTTVGMWSSIIKDMSSRGRDRYKRLRDFPSWSKSTKHRSRDDYYDDQFEDSAPAKPPVKSIAVAVILFVSGR